LKRADDSQEYHTRPADANPYRARGLLRSALEVEMNEDEKRRIEKQEEGTHPAAGSPGLNSNVQEMVHAPGEDGPPISPLEPSSMPRAEEDDETMANSPEFNDQPGSGKHLLEPD
jgi:hypothetical protein